MEHQTQLADYVRTIETALAAALPAEALPQAVLSEAMGYSLLAGGKRLRPVLLLAFYRMAGGEGQSALPFACALEMIHTYSLIHDDLPAMDDDELRRGRPTNHKVYGEATALLAGSSLLSAAFEIMLSPPSPLPAERVCQAAYLLARASGLYGMAGGQQLDMNHTALPASPESAALIHRLKTGALIQAAAHAGCLLAGASTAQIDAACAYADALGLAFQMTDDVLDVEGDPQQLGKATGKDAAADKLTFAALLGIPECRRQIQAYTEQAVSHLQAFDRPDFLLWLTRSLVSRTK